MGCGPALCIPTVPFTRPRREGYQLNSAPTCPNRPPEACTCAYMGEGLGGPDRVGEAWEVGGSLDTPIGR